MDTMNPESILSYLAIARWSALLAIVLAPVGIWHVRIWAASRELLGLREFLFLAALYLVGKCAQSWIVGPQLLRWHLADLGFVPFTALVVFAHGWLAGAHLDRCLWVARLAAGIACVVATMFELLQMVGAERDMFYGGDFVDIAMFVIGYFGSHRLLTLAMQDLERIKAGFSLATLSSKGGTRV
jgi:hypothetical protein